MTKFPHKKPQLLHTVLHIAHLLRSQCQSKTSDTPRNYIICQTWFCRLLISRWRCESLWLLKYGSYLRKFAVFWQLQAGLFLLRKSSLFLVFSSGTTNFSRRTTWLMWLFAIVLLSNGIVSKWGWNKNDNRLCTDVLPPTLLQEGRGRLYTG